MTYSNGASGLEVQQMFGSIAARYDRANSVLSFGIHHLWRKTLVGMLPPSSNLKVLDLCTGTGDLLPILQDRFGPVIGADFCLPMLKAGVERVLRKGARHFPLLQSDALAMPFGDESFDVVSVSFGVRNFENLNKGLQEIRRVLKPGGKLLVLEFGQPCIPGFAAAFRFYSKHLMPIIGGMLTGNKQAYAYLPRTSAAFPCGKDFSKILAEQGFVPRRAKMLSGGIAYAYCAERAV